MSSWDVNYHRGKLELYTGVKWTRDYRGSDPNKLFRKLEGERAKLAQYDHIERSARLIRVAAMLSAFCGLVLSVWSSLAGVDAGAAAGALLGFGIPGFFLSVAGSLALAVWLKDQRDAVAALEDAYNEALEARADV